MSFLHGWVFFVLIKFGSRYTKIPILYIPLRFIDYKLASGTMPSVPLDFKWPGRYLEWVSFILVFLRHVWTVISAKGDVYWKIAPLIMLFDPSDL